MLTNDQKYVIKIAKSNTCDGSLFIAADNGVIYMAANGEKEVVAHALAAFFMQETVLFGTVSRLLANGASQAFKAMHKPTHKGGQA